MLQINTKPIPYANLTRQLKWTHLNCIFITNTRKINTDYIFCTHPFIKLNIMDYIRIIILFAGLTIDQTKSLLSLPPEANDWPSGDHFRPQTSCLWPCRIRFACTAVKKRNKILILWVILVNELVAWCQRYKLEKWWRC